MTDFKSAEIADTRLNTGSATECFVSIKISPIFSDPKVLPAHVNTLDPLIETVSEGDNSLIGDDLSTKSPLKSNANPENADEF